MQKVNRNGETNNRKLANRCLDLQTSTKQMKHHRQITNTNKEMQKHTTHNEQITEHEQT